MKRMKFKPRNVNLKTVRLTDGTMIYAGESMYEVNCGQKIKRWMIRNLFKNASRTQIIFPVRQKIARELLIDNHIVEVKK